MTQLISSDDQTDLRSFRDPEGKHYIFINTPEEDYSSTCEVVYIGVSQGCTLSPVIFLLYINIFPDDLSEIKSTIDNILTELYG
ncbi:hypothetical protein J6590_100175 [Homalodisca vitripennis]|nr:hypothetical protein J6590_100175 [Homalodisca vitripennis]